MWLTTGLINTGAAGLDSEVSKDNGTFADCTNEATEVATASGSYYLDLTNTEMNADVVEIQVKSSTTNAITYKLTIYPSSLGKIQVDVRSLLGTAWLTPGTAGTPDVNAKLLGGTAQTGRDIGASVLLSSGTGTGQLKLASGYVAMTWADIAAPTTTVALTGTTISTAQTIATVTNLTNAPTNGDLTATMKTSVTTAATAATPTINATQAFSNTGTWTGNIVGTLSTVTTLTNLPAITADWLTGTGIAASAVTKLQNGLSTLDAAGVRAAIGLASANLDTQIGTLSTLTAAGVRTAVGLASANLDTQILTLATGTNLAIVAGYLDTEIAAIKLKTDLLTADIATFATRGLTMLVVDGAVYQFTVNALELAPSGGGGGGFTSDDREMLEHIDEQVSPPAVITITSHIGEDGSITERRGDKWEIPIPGLGNLADVDELWFAVKPSQPSSDNQSLVFITLSDGLVRLNGAAAGTAGDGSITIDDEAAGDITITLEAAATKVLEATSATYAIKTQAGDDLTTLVSGDFSIVLTLIDAPE